MFAVIGGLGMQELIIILVILLLLFGSTRLPQLARGMGKSIREFKKGVSDGESDAQQVEGAERREVLRAAADERVHEDELASDRAAANRPR